MIQLPKLLENYEKVKVLPLRSNIIANMAPLKRFSKDVKRMTGRKPNLYWQITWKFISPLLLLIVFVAFVTLQIQKPPSYAAWNPKYVCFLTSNKSKSCIFFSLTISFKIMAIYCLPT